MIKNKNVQKVIDIAWIFFFPQLINQFACTYIETKVVSFRIFFPKKGSENISYAPRIVRGINVVMYLLYKEFNKISLMNLRL